jgi:hypothetical protein
MASFLAVLGRPVVWLGLLIVIALSYSWMSPEISAPNERSRLYLTLSVIESSSISVNDQIERYGKPFDIAERDGKFYSDKAPGSSIIAVPFVAVYKAFGGSDSIEALTNFARTFIMIPFSLLSFLLLRLLLLRLDVRPVIANQTGIAFIIGTSFFHYGSAFFGHALVACAALSAAVSLERSLTEDHVSRRYIWRFFLGFSGGVAFTIEYQAALLCIAIAVAYLSVRSNWRIKRVIAPLSGALIPITATLIYNVIAFGGPFETSYGHLYHAYSQNIHSKGLFGVTFPSVDALYGLIFSPSRGLLLCTPIVVLGIFGAKYLWRRSRGLAIYVGVSCIAYLVLVAGTEIWYGGWGFGPRLLVPIFGLAAIPGGLALAEWSSSAMTSIIARTYVIAGILYNATVITAFPELPATISSPLKTVALPLLKIGSPSPNLGMTLLNLNGASSLLPLAVILIILCGYMLLNHSISEFHFRNIFSIVAVFFCFSIFAFGYPETKPQKDAQNFVRSMSEMRVYVRE